MSRANRKVCKFRWPFSNNQQYTNIYRKGQMLSVFKINNGFSCNVCWCHYCSIERRNCLVNYTYECTSNCRFSHNWLYEWGFAIPYKVAFKCPYEWRGESWHMFVWEIGLTFIIMALCKQTEYCCCSSHSWISEYKSQMNFGYS